MQNNSKCILCGRPLATYNPLCYECEAKLDSCDTKIEYAPDQKLVPNTSFGQRMIDFFEAFFARPEVQTAYEEYAQALCDPPS